MAAHSAFRRLLDEAAALEMRELQRKRAMERRAAKAKANEPYMVGLREFAALEAALSRPAAEAATQAPNAPGGARKASAAPREPEPHECCGNDCPNCVWIQYWEKLQAYEEQA